MVSFNCYDILIKQNWNENTARNELYKKDLLPVIYTTSPQLGTLARISQVAKRVFSLLIFPIYLSEKCYQFVHRLMGNYLVPASIKNRNQVIRFVENWNLTTFLMTSIPITVGLFSSLSQVRFPDASWVPFQSQILKALGKRDFEEGKKWQYQRFTIEAQEEKIDAIFIGKKKSSGWFSREGDQESRRIIVYCCSQDELAEGKIYDNELLKLAEKTHSDIVVWNPPGVGATPGQLSRDSMVKTCGAMMQFVEDARGLCAKEVIYSGHSLGSSILLAAAQNQQSAVGVRRVFVLRSAFSTMQEALSCSISSFVGISARLLGWNLNNTEALERIQDPVIMLQTALVDGYETLKDSSKLIPDAVIEDPDATLAKVALSQKKLNPLHKVVGIPRWHDEPLAPQQVEALSKDIEGFFHAGT